MAKYVLSWRDIVPSNSGNRTQWGEHEDMIYSDSKNDLEKIAKELNWALSDEERKKGRYFVRKVK